MIEWPLPCVYGSGGKPILVNGRAKVCYLYCPNFLNVRFPPFFHRLTGERTFEISTWYCLCLFFSLPTPLFRGLWKHLPICWRHCLKSLFYEEIVCFHKKLIREALIKVRFFFVLESGMHLWRDWTISWQSWLTRLMVHFFFWNSVVFSRNMAHCILASKRSCTGFETARIIIHLPGKEALYKELLAAFDGNVPLELVLHRFSSFCLLV